MRSSAAGRVLAAGTLSPLFFFWKERELFLVSFHCCCTTARCVRELPEDNSRVHWGKVTPGCHGGDPGGLPEPPSRAPRPSSRSSPSRGSWLPPNWGPDSSPRRCLGTTLLSPPAQIHRQAEAVSREMGVCRRLRGGAASGRAPKCDPGEVSSQIPSSRCCIQPKNCRSLLRAHGDSTPREQIQNYLIEKGQSQESFRATPNALPIRGLLGLSEAAAF